MHNSMLFSNFGTFSSPPPMRSRAPFTVFTAYVIPNLLFLSTDLPSLNISYEERHTTRGLLSLASSPENDVFEVRPDTASVSLFFSRLRRILPSASMVPRSLPLPFHWLELKSHDQTQPQGAPGKVVRAPQGRLPTVSRYWALPRSLQLPH